MGKSSASKKNASGKSDDTDELKLSTWQQIKQSDIYSRLFFFSVFCYVLSIAWILLLPLVSVSTGELKPRRLFVDEHAILLQNNALQSKSSADSVYGNLHQIDDLHPVYISSSNDKLEFSKVCDLFEEKSSYCGLMKDSNGIELHAKTATQALETTVLVFLYPRDCNMIQTQMYALIYNILCALELSSWTGKQTVILMRNAVTHNTSFSRMHLPHSNDDQWLREWLSHYDCQLSSLTNLQTCSSHNLLREAYIVDFTKFATHSVCTSDQSSGNGSGQYKIESSESKFQVIDWEDMELLLAGANGNLPNMDLVSYITSLYGNNGKDKIISISGWCDGIGGISIYYQHLCGLMEHMYELVTGSDGLHGAFLLHNIDSVTLRLNPNSNGRKSKTVNDVVQIALNLLFVSNNLEGKLDPTIIIFASILQFN